MPHVFRGDSTPTLPVPPLVSGPLAAAGLTVERLVLNGEDLELRLRSVWGPATVVLTPAARAQPGSARAGAVAVWFPRQPQSLPTDRLGALTRAVAAALTPVGIAVEALLSRGARLARLRAGQEPIPDEGDAGALAGLLVALQPPGPPADEGFRRSHRRSSPRPQYRSPTPRSSTAAWRPRISTAPSRSPQRSARAAAGWRRTAC